MQASLLVEERERENERKRKEGGEVYYCDAAIKI